MVKQGRPIAETVKRPHQCHFCLKEEPFDASFGKCNQCKTVVYCSKSCQKRDWHEHGPLCNAISIMEQKRQALTKSKSVTL